MHIPLFQNLDLEWGQNICQSKDKTFFVELKGHIHVIDEIFNTCFVEVYQRNSNTPKIWICKESLAIALDTKYSIERPFSQNRL